MAVPLASNSVVKCLGGDEGRLGLGDCPLLDMRHVTTTSCIFKRGSMAYNTRLGTSLNLFLLLVSKIEELNAAKAEKQQEG